MGSEREAMRILRDDLMALKMAVNDFGCANDIDPELEVQRILLNRLATQLDNLREFERWMDARLERRWWLSELVK